MIEQAVGLLHGRRVIKTDVQDITADNVIAILQKALPVHWRNKSDIEYLYAVYKGRQKILGRVKQVRPEICNKIVENRFAEIVNFKVGYLVGEPLQYVGRGSEEDTLQSITRLNDFMVEQDKDAEDAELAEWFHVAGTGYRMVLPVDRPTEEYESPFEIYTLDPRFAFVVYFSGLGERPVMGVKYVVLEDGRVVYDCYTKDCMYEIVGGSIVRAEPHVLGGIPIIEYPMNKARIGAAELVLPLLDAINMVDSNRVDGVEQFIQSLMRFHNVDLSSDDFTQLREEGAIKYRDVDPQMKAEVDYITNELKQGETQVLVDHLYQVVLTICGMPNRNGGSSTSDTGSAVIMRDGWSAAESQARNSERMWRKPEKAFLCVVLNICNTLAGMNLRISDIEIRFTRRNYENILEKSQVLLGMLGNEKIAPRLAFVHSGMFSDPELAYRESVEYAKSQEEKAQAQVLQEVGVNEVDTSDDRGNRKQSVTRQASGNQD